MLKNTPNRSPTGAHEYCTVCHCVEEAGWGWGGGGVGWGCFILENKTLQKQNKQKINIKKLPYTLFGRAGTTKIKETTVFVEDMYILYKQ